jgi:hypothetical protein
MSFGYSAPDPLEAVPLKADGLGVDTTTSRTLKKQTRTSSIELS